MDKRDFKCKGCKELQEKYDTLRHGANIVLIIFFVIIIIKAFIY